MLIELFHKLLARGKDAVRADRVTVRLEPQDIALQVAQASADAIRFNLSQGLRPDGKGSLPPLAPSTIADRASEARRHGGIADGPRGTITGATVGSIGVQRSADGSVAVGANEDRPGHLARILGGAPLVPPKETLAAAARRVQQGLIKKG